MDYDKAIHYFKLSAEKGFEPSVYAYAVELAAGKYIKANIDLSIKLMQKVAILGMMKLLIS